MQNINSFLKQNAPFLTVKDLSEELGINEYMVRKKCAELGIEPIKKGEQTKQFILAHYKSKTPAQIAKILDCGEANLRAIYKELNLPFGKQLDAAFLEAKAENDFPLKEATANVAVKNKSIEKRPSVREIFGSFQVDGKIHYHNLRDL
jgi:hypothetical protein